MKLKASQTVLHVPGLAECGEGENGETKRGERNAVTKIVTFLLYHRKTSYYLWSSTKAVGNVKELRLRPLQLLAARLFSQAHRGQVRK